MSSSKSKSAKSSTVYSDSSDDLCEDEDEVNRSKTSISTRSTHVKSLAKEIKLFKKSRKMYFFTSSIVRNLVTFCRIFQETLILLGVKIFKL